MKMLENWYVKKQKYAFTLCLLTLLQVKSWAQEQGEFAPSKRTTTASYMLGAGSMQILDTYLSQEHFQGTGYMYLSTVERQRDNRHWATEIQHQVEVSKVYNRTKTTTELEGAYNFFWGKYRSWNLFNDRLCLQAGGMANVNIGFIYNTLNGNNPAQARVSLNIMPSIAATWRFILWKRHMFLRYEQQFPLVGLAFSPNYGQTYYEMFSRGNYDKNVVLTTFLSAPTFRQMITLNVNVSKSTTIAIGYLGDIRQLQVNNLKQHFWFNSLMIGIVRRFKIINLRP